jgi:putrescine aminotransferase
VGVQGAQIDIGEEGRSDGCFAQASRLCSATMSAREHPAAIQYATHVNPAFVKLLGAFGYGRVFTRARGTKLWDSDGREYLDLLAAFGVMNLGHNSEKLRDRAKAFLDDDVVNLCHVGIQVHAAELAARLATGKLSRVLFSSSGGEAVESAMKLARAATRRKPILYCTGGFHGTGFGPLSVMGSKRMREPFEPLVGECFEVPFDDLPALERGLEKQRPAAFVVEPIQAEAGVKVPKEGYFAKAYELCRRQGTLMVLDEVQTGLGRTGKMYAYEHEGVVPDVLVLGKALGGGLVPISAALTTPEIHDRAYGRMDRFDLHSTTFSGNTFGCRVALAGLDIIAEDGLIENAHVRGEQLLAGLRAKLEGHPFIKGIFGRGLLVGLELGPAKEGFFDKLVEGVSKHVFGQWLALRLLESGIVAQPASQQWNVLKIEPALTVTAAEIDQAIGAVTGILAEYKDLRSIVADAGKRLGTQAMAGWTF